MSVATEKRFNPSYSPWGKIQHRRTIAPGIVEVSTPGHGGILVSRERDLFIRATFPSVAPYAGSGAYEEDCDWAIVALAFPDLFTDSQLRAAVNTVKVSASWSGACPHWADVLAWLSTPAAAPILARVDSFTATIADKWEQGSMGSPPRWAPSGAWWVCFTRERDGAKRSGILPGYPDRQFYTDAELSALMAQVPQSDPNPPAPTSATVPSYGGSYAEPSDADPGL